MGAQRPALGLPPASAPAHPPASTYQGATAEQDHEDNEGLKPVVLDDLEAGPAEGPPLLPAALGDVHVEAGTALHTGWGAKGRLSQAWWLPPDACQHVPVTSQDAPPPPDLYLTAPRPGILTSPQSPASCPPLLVG